MHIIWSTTILIARALSVTKENNFSVFFKTPKWLFSIGNRQFHVFVMATFENNACMISLLWRRSDSQACTFLVLVYKDASLRIMILASRLDCSRNRQHTLQVEWVHTYMLSPRRLGITHTIIIIWITFWIIQCLCYNSVILRPVRGAVVD